ncbi:MAG: hypothetical protein U5J99_04165 [Parvularculaceae bacterium]|nr:hypothetical protein [Parvularculaceae bacterium]
MKSATAVLVAFFMALSSTPSSAMPRIFYPENPQEVEAAIGETGKRRMCMSFEDISAVIPVKSNMAIFVGKNGEKYVNNFISGCKGLLDPEGTLQFQLTSARFCRNDRLYVFARAAAAPSGSCAVGDFKLIVEPARALTLPEDTQPVN